MNQFDQVWQAHEQPSQSGTPSHTCADSALEKIRQRLDRALPNDPYLTDEQVANVLRLETKTLVNNRHAKPLRYLQPLKLFDLKTNVHPRDQVIEWLAREELNARARTIHRCR